MTYKFTNRANKAIEIANDIALELGHSYIGTEHILYGLAKEGNGIASKVLENQNVTADDILNKIEELIKNKNIIRNKLKIKASINNSKIFKQIIKENGTFYNYLLTFTKGNIYYNSVDTRSKLSDDISKDLTKRGMKFVGTTIIFSYLQAVGIINSHQENCFLFHK